MSRVKLYIQFSHTFFLFAVGFVIFAFLANQGFAQDVTKKHVTKRSSEAPTKIRSDIIDIKRKSQTVDLIGNVVVEKEDSSFLSKKMTVLYDEKKGNKSPKNGDEESDKKSSVKKIYTDEKVKIFSQEFVATGDSGYYDPKEDVFVLERNVMVNNGVSVAQGDKFVYNITTKKSNFIGQKQDGSDQSDKRVVIIIGDDNKDFKKSDLKKSSDKKIPEKK